MTLSPHDRYEELVAGHALSALEPADEQELLRHLQSCAVCERDLARHRETLSHLAYAGDEGEPPPGLWAGIRSAVEAESGPGAFAASSGAGPSLSDRSAPATGSTELPVTDLSAARARRRPAARRAAAWTSVAAGVALVASLGYGLVQAQQARDEQGDATQRLAAAVRAVETAPARTVPLTGSDGRVTAVAVLQPGSMSLIVDGLPQNDTGSSVYVLWGRTGTGPTRALGTFDVTSEGLHVLRDMPEAQASGPTPDLLAITREPGRTAPAVTQQPVVASGRLA